MVDIPLEDIVNLTIVAGEVMLKNGAETSRVEETMEHIAQSCGATAVESFVIPTGVFLTVTDTTGRSLTTLRRVKDWTINLDRISKVNELSRRLADRRMGFSDAKILMERISQEPAGFSLMPSLIASGLIGGSFVVLQNGCWSEALGAFSGAVLGQCMTYLVSCLQVAHFTSEFLGALTAALVGSIVHSVWPSVSRDMIIVGGLMPLVPGVAITNAIRDIMAGDFLSGVSRGMEAALTSVAIAIGVVIVLAIQLTWL